MAHMSQRLYSGMASLPGKPAAQNLKLLCLKNGLLLRHGGLSFWPTWLSRELLGVDMVVNQIQPCSYVGFRTAV